MRTQGKGGQKRSNFVDVFHGWPLIHYSEAGIDENLIIKFVFFIESSEFFVHINVMTMDNLLYDCSKKYIFALL